MRLLIVGGGAREHAIAWKLTGERQVHEVVCAPGNVGIAAIARCVSVDPADPESVLAVIEREGIDLTVIGPELPLSVGVVDLLTSKGRLVLGPMKAAAQLESSKAFAKAFMARHHVPTARFVMCESAET